jgi:hypothetical protein
MATRSVATQGNERPEEAWARWVSEHGDKLERATGPQRVLLEAAVRFIAIIGGHAIMLRAASFFLFHTGMGLTPALVGAAIGRTDRAMRMVQTLSAHDFLESVWAELRRHRQPKLRAEHAGPIAKYLVDHPHETQAEVVAFIERELGIHIDPLTLRRFLKAYGLNVLRPERGDREQAGDARPFP